MSALLCRMYSLDFILRKKERDQVPQICISKLHSSIVAIIHIRCSQKNDINAFVYCFSYRLLFMTNRFKNIIGYPMKV